MLAQQPKKLLLEVMYKADYCLLCYYMDEAICDIMPLYHDRVEYRRVEFLKGDGRERFLELSISLFGREGVFNKKRIAPVPSLFIDGELVFDGIPPRHDLIDAIEEALEAQDA